MPSLESVLTAQGASLWRRVGLTAVTVILAAGLWWPTFHLWFGINLDEYFRPEGMPPRVREIARRHLDLWTKPELRQREISRMRGSNAEWDFMGRTFFVLALANMSLREPASQAVYLDIIDQIVLETVKLEKEKSFYYFLMKYSRDQSFIASPAHSIFVDGEIGLMIAARQMVQVREDFRPLLKERIETFLPQMQAGAVLCGESYPDECWVFCNSIALAALRLYDILEGEDHSDFFRKWLATARARLVHPETGLLISSLKLDGTHLDGPEGSTIWLTAHCLDVVDETFARDQYQRARKELIATIFRFPYSREWPSSCKGAEDIDSGPIIPILEVSAGASGLAFLGAGSFEDRELLSGLLSSLEFGGFPIHDGGSLRYGASNQVGDAVVLYSLTCGPLWKNAKARMKR